MLCPHSQSNPPQSDQSHDRATFGLVLPEVRGYGRQVGPAGHVRNPLVAAGGLTALDVFVVFVDAGQRGHVENVSDAVLRLLSRALDVGRRDLLGHAGTLRRKRSNMVTAGSEGSG